MKKKKKPRGLLNCEIVVQLVLIFKFIIPMCQLTCHVLLYAQRNAEMGPIVLIIIIIAKDKKNNNNNLEMGTVIGMWKLHM